MKFDAAIHDKQIGNSEKESAEVSDQDQSDIDNALKAAQIRKRLEMESRRG